MKLNGIICAVQVRYKEEGAKLLFHATDDCLCEYELPSTVTGCLTLVLIPPYNSTPSHIDDIGI